MWGAGVNTPKRNCPLSQNDNNKFLLGVGRGGCYSITGTRFSYYISSGTIWWASGNGAHRSYWVLALETNVSIWDMARAIRRLASVAMVNRDISWFHQPSMKPISAARFVVRSLAAIRFICGRDLIWTTWANFKVLVKIFLCVKFFHVWHFVFADFVISFTLWGFHL